MTQPFDQENLSLSIETPAGPDAFRVEEVRGEEGISQPFRWEVDLVSADPEVDFRSLVGEPVSLTMEVAGADPRRIHGIVTQFSQGATDPSATRYRAVLRPWLWLLSLSSDSKIHQNLSVPQILENVFTEHAYSDFEIEVATREPKEYCVQYQESALAFVSRLMEEEGIYYYFRHEADRHVLVLADDPAAYAPCPGIADFEYRRSSREGEYPDLIVDCDLEERITTGEFDVGDYSFLTPSTDLDVSVTGSAGVHGRYEYPAGYEATADGEAVGRRFLEAEEAERLVLRGGSACRTMVPGHTFSLRGHDRTDVNRDWVVRHLHLSATQEAYQNSFVALPDDLSFRPPRTTPRPRIPGSQTAVVVGKSGEEIWTDEHGRVKLQFHWDREGSADQDSSCWVRVSQGWAGKAWGALFVPRVGQEVVVSFLSGDPDRPLVTGAVYNGENTPPHSLPDEGTRSGIRSNSSKGGGGSNELRFEDEKEKEELYLHAQRDMLTEVENDQTVEVRNDRAVTVKNALSVSVQEGDETRTIEQGNRTTSVKGDETLGVDGDRSVEVKGNETADVDGDLSRKVGGGVTLDITGDLTIKAGGNVTIEAGGSLELNAGSSLTSQAGTGLTNKAGTSLTNEAGTSLTNKAGTSLTNDAALSLTDKGGASVKIEASGVLEAQGAMVKLN